MWILAVAVTFVITLANHVTWKSIFVNIQERSRFNACNAQKHLVKTAHYPHTGSSYTKHTLTNSTTVSFVERVLSLGASWKSTGEPTVHRRRRLEVMPHVEETSFFMQIPVYCSNYFVHIRSCLYTTLDFEVVKQLIACWPNVVALKSVSVFQTYS